MSSLQSLKPDNRVKQWLVGKGPSQGIHFRVPSWSAQEGKFYLLQSYFSYIYPKWWSLLSILQFCFCYTHHNWWSLLSILSFELSQCPLSHGINCKINLSLWNSSYVFNLTVLSIVSNVFPSTVVINITSVNLFKHF